MTIFLTVLHSLVDEELIELSGDLQNQIKSKDLVGKLMTFGHNQELSRAQKKVVDDLRVSICQFTGGDNDKDSKDTIVTAIENAINKLNDVRTAHKAKEKSNTITAINDLCLKVKNFYKKLEKFEFSLLDIEHDPKKPQPEEIVYSHAAAWLGTEIFKPANNIDKTLRSKKEKALKDRLEILSKIIKTDTSFEDRSKWSKRALEDLNTDNKNLTKGNNTAVPGLSFFGGAISLTTDSLHPGQGRLKGQLKQATREIDALSSSASSSSSAYLNQDNHSNNDNNDDDDDAVSETGSHHSLQLT